MTTFEVFHILKVSKVPFQWSSKSLFLKNPKGKSIIQLKL